MEENGSKWGDVDVVPPTVDSKGRPNPESMSDRELLIELVRGMRQAQDGLEQLLPMLEQMGNNPMLKMFFPKTK